MSEWDMIFLLASARNNDPRALFNVGLGYDKGVNGFPQDKAMAEEYYEKSAKQGQAEAQVNLGSLFKEKNEYTKAVYWFKKAVLQNNADAQNNLANCYSGGEGVERDLEAAVRLFRLATKQDHKSALFNLGNCYRDGLGVELSYSKAVDLYRRGAHLNHGPSLFCLAKAFHIGQGVERDLSKATQYFQIAAHLDVAVAQVALAQAYSFGDRGLPEDQGKAREWFSRGLANGFVPERQHCEQLADWTVLAALGRNFQSNFSKLSYKGDILVPKLVDLANEGNPVAMYTLGHWIDEGMNSMTQDKAAAKRCYEIAAEKGEERAQYKIGSLFWSGEGPDDVDYEKAAHFFQLSAAQHYAPAQVALGRAYELGRGVPQNPIKALQLYQEAAENDSVCALQRIEELTAFLLQQKHHTDHYINLFPLNDFRREGKCNCLSV